MLGKRIIFLLLLIIFAYSCSDNCNDCDPSGTICFACKQDFELSVFGNCISNKIDKCIVYGPDNECFVCQPSFDLVDGKCVKQYSGCLNKNYNDNSCFQCGFGKSLVNGLCMGSINCGKPDPICLICQQGFQLIGGVCVDKTQGCLNRRNQDGVCTTCKQGFKLIGYKCIKKQNYVPYCYVYTNSTVCQRCKNGYSLFQNYCMLPTQIQNILTKTLTLQNTVLMLLTETKNSQLAIQSLGESTTNSTGNTSNTNSNTNTTTNTTTGTITNTVSIPSCIRQNQNICLECQTNYILSKGQCNLLDINCASYQLATGICIQCIPGYELSVGSCVKKVTPSIANCQVINPVNTSQCLICVYGYFPNKNECTKVSRFCGDFNVQTGACFNCQFALQLTNGKCLDSNCLSWNGQICTKCSTTYNVNNNGICQFVDPNCALFKGSICDKCKDGFYFNLKGLCLKLPNNCKYGNVQTQGVCIECLQNFLLTPNGTCMIPNCAIYANNKCSVCIDGYSVNSNGTCTLIIPNCAVVQNNVCKTCNQGYVNYRTGCAKLISNCDIYSGITTCSTCRQGYSLNSMSNACNLIIPNCANIQNDICSGCNIGYYLRNNLCFKVSNLCASYNLTTGACLTCITGYTLNSNNGLCLDINCKTQNQDKCLECKQNFRIMGTSILCTFFDPNCISMTNTLCQQCIQGFVVGVNGVCVKNTNTNTNTNTTTNTTNTTNTNTNTNININTDVNCKQWSTLNSTQCITCSNRYYLNADKKCIPVNALCQTYNSQGSCTTCYQGYSLVNNLCAVIADVDPACKVKNALSQCIQCYGGYYLNSISRKCQSLNPLCRTSNLQTGECLTCYPGYTLSLGNCAVFFRDVNCQSYDLNNVCKLCSQRYYIDAVTAKCVSVSPLCKSYNQTNGQCSSCYEGYRLNNGFCGISTLINSDVNCKNSTNINNTPICIQCYSGYFIKLGKCQKINLLCKTSNQSNGFCLTCYPGYILNSTTGECVVATQGQLGDPNCKEFTDTTKTVCRICYDGYYLKNNNACAQFNPLCKSSSIINGDCLTCYPGYSLSNGNCVISMSQSLNSTSGQAVVSDPYCIQLISGICVQCSEGYFINSKGICQQADPYCKTYNRTTGDCLTCYDGFVLNSPKCVIAQLINIPYCLNNNGAGTCLECIDGYFLRNNSCVAVPITCATYNKLTGICLSCISGYFFQNGQCIFPAFGIDPGCSFYVNGFCTTCSRGYYLSNYICTQVNRFCLQFDYTNNTCKNCFNNKMPVGAECI